MDDARASLATPNQVHIWCPGCDTAHGIVYGEGGKTWTWNGDLRLPTFSPSLLVTYTYGNGMRKEDPRYSEETRVCHSFVTDGRIQFLTDSTHHLAGQTVDLPVWPYGKE